MVDDSRDSGNIDSTDALTESRSKVQLSDTGISSMQGIDPDNGIDDIPDQSEKDIDAVLDDVQTLREQQQQELQEDLAAVNEQKAAYRAAHPDTYEGVSAWEDRKIVDMPVSYLPQPEDIQGPEDFDHHISHDDAIQAVNELKQMKPLIDQGYTSDDFKRLDQQNGVTWENGQQRIYDLFFYGSDQVTVIKDGDNYIIDKGRHRIYAAKEAGLETLPVHLYEKVYH